MGANAVVMTTAARHLRELDAESSPRYFDYAASIATLLGCAIEVNPYLPPGLTVLLGPGREVIGVLNLRKPPRPKPDQVFEETPRDRVLYLTGLYPHWPGFGRMWPMAVQVEYVETFLRPAPLGARFAPQGQHERLEAWGVMREFAARADAWSGL